MNFLVGQRVVCMRDGEDFFVVPLGVSAASLGVACPKRGDAYVVGEVLEGSIGPTLRLEKFCHGWDARAFLPAEGAFEALVEIAADPGAALSFETLRQAQDEGEREHTDPEAKIPQSPLRTSTPPALPGGVGEGGTI